MGNSDLSPPEFDPGAPQRLAGRGLVVFPGPDRRRRPRLLAAFAPFLITVVAGAIVVVIVALVR